MASEHRLAASSTTLLNLTAGAEIFCAAGALHLRTLPQCPGAPAQTQSITVGQSWRAHSSTLVTLEALEASRYYTLRPPHAALGLHGPENKNASHWNRLASWVRRQWLLWAGHAGARVGGAEVGGR